MGCGRRPETAAGKLWRRSVHLNSCRKCAPRRRRSLGRADAKPRSPPRWCSSWWPSRPSSSWWPTSSCVCSSPSFSALAGEGAGGMSDKHWYIIQAYSNFERKVADSIREQAKQRHLEHLFEEVMVPTEKVVEVRRGQKVDAERKFFPGYVLVKMDLTDEAYHLIKNTPKVTGFLGADNKPKPISDAEAARIMHQVQEGIERPKPSVSFEVGEQVRVS